MLPEFPQFKKLELSDKEEIEKFTSKFPPYSDFNFVSMRFKDYLLGNLFLFLGILVLLILQPVSLVFAGSTTYTYDQNGNILTETTAGQSTKYYTWDYENHLIKSVVNGITTTYAYDHTGQRIKSTSGGVTTIYPSKYYNTNGTKKTKNIYVGDQLVATIETVGTTVTPYYVHTDHLGSTNVVTDKTGAIVETTDYYPYGSVRLDQKTTSFSGQRKYIGQEYDELTKLNYLNARYYDSKRGQLISQDPVFWEIGQTEDGKKALLNPQSQNSYSYANNNPIRNSDPQGRISGNLIYDVLAGLFLPSVAYSPNVGEEHKTNVALERNLMLMSLASPNGESKAGAKVVVNSANNAIKIIKNTNRVLTNEERQEVSGIIENPKLRNIFNTFFKAEDELPGGTAGAIKFTKETGQLIKDSDHLVKGQGFLNGLNKIVGNTNINQTDKSIAQTLIKQLKNAIKGQ